MTTKIKKTKSNRGRPKKDFSIIEVKKNNTNEQRSRGRPKKEIRVEESVNTKIHNHTKEISKLSKDNEKLHSEIKNTSFVSKKINKNDNKKSDNFALGLLIFSMLLFIFSLYKTFYTNNDNIIIKTEPKITIQEQINENIIIETGNVLIKDVSNESNSKPNIDIIEDIKKINDYDIINTFYNEINNKNFSEINNLVDNYLKSSNVFRTYYNSNWLSRFIWKLANQKVYLTNIKEINLENKKEWVSNYSYIIKYKLNDNNELFQEEWEAAVVTKWDKKIIWSLRCITTWCSKMPFFNLPRYEK